MLNQITKQWPSILEILESETSTVSFQTWFKNLKPVDVRDNTLFIETIDDFSKDILKNRYIRLIQNAIIQVTHHEFEIQIVTSNEFNQSQKYNSIKDNDTDPLDNQSNLNPTYFFDSF